MVSKGGGGSGIRTHVGVTQTCFQDMRLQPLGHPSRLEDFTIMGRASTDSRWLAGLLVAASCGRAPQIIILTALGIILSL